MVEATPQNGLDDPVISIGILAEKVGLSVSAVRKYETEGLLIAHRTASGHRLFSHEDIQRVRNIKHLIQDLGLNMEGIRRMQALLPCWELLPCDPENKRSCAAYQVASRACWTIKGLACAPQGNECRKCVVYRLGSLCTEDMKQLVHDPLERGSTDAVVARLVRRIRDSNEGRQ